MDTNHGPPIPVYEPSPRAPALQGRQLPGIERLDLLVSIEYVICIEAKHLTLMCAPAPQFADGYLDAVMSHHHSSAATVISLLITFPVKHLLESQEGPGLNSTS